MRRRHAVPELVAPAMGIAGARGASLVEALMAIALVVVMLSGVAQLLVWSRRAVWSAGSKSIAVSTAVQKMEALQSLHWAANPDGTPLSDDSTRLSTDPATAGGSGLRPSPPGALGANTPDFVDYLDDRGRWCGTGAEPPRCAAFVRRWSIESFAPDGGDTIVLSVLVLPLADALISAGYIERGARLTAVRTRVVR